jgi:hypothetical protein
VVAVEAKDFEIARTPTEIAGELEKLFKGKKGKKSTVDLHARRLNWLGENLAEVVRSLGEDPKEGEWHAVGRIVTSDPLVTPLVETSPLPIIPFVDLDIEALQLHPSEGANASTRRNRKRR